MYQLTDFLLLNFYNWHLNFNGFVALRYVNELSFFLFVFISTLLKSKFMPGSYILFVGLNILYAIFISQGFVITNINFFYLMLDCWYVTLSKIFSLLIFCFILLMIHGKLIKTPDLHRNFLFLLNVLILFIFIFLSSYDFILTYLSLEGISLVMYVLGGIFTGNLLSLEAILKYFFLNSITSSIMILGISMLFGLYGSLDFLELYYISIDNFPEFVAIDVYIVVLFSLCGLLFKLGAFPFNWWVADVYEGLWTPVTACFAILVKTSVFFLFFRLVLHTFSPFLFLLQPFILISAIISILIGSLGAYYQVRLKRFIAYASIAQVGHILLGVGCCSLLGFLGALIHLLLYSILTLAFFCLLINYNNVFSGKNAVFFHEFKNFFKFNYQTSYQMCFILFGMAAFPPMGTFFSKMIIYVALIEAKLEFLVFLILLCNLISAYYYLKFVQDVFFFNLTSIEITYSFKSSLTSLIHILVNISIIITTLFIFILIFKFDFFASWVLSGLYPFFYY